MSSNGSAPRVTLEQAREQLAGLIDARDLPLPRSTTLEGRTLFVKLVSAAHVPPWAAALAAHINPGRESLPDGAHRWALTLTGADAVPGVRTVAYWEGPWVPAGEPEPDTDGEDTDPARIVSLAKVESAVIGIGQRTDLTEVERAERQSELWESAARAWARGLRRIDRYLRTARAQFPHTTRYQELTHIIDEVVGPELPDNPQPGPDGGGS